MAYFSGLRWARLILDRVVWVGISSNVCFCFELKGVVSIEGVGVFGEEDGGFESEAIERSHLMLEQRLEGWSADLCRNRTENHDMNLVRAVCLPTSSLLPGA